MTATTTEAEVGFRPGTTTYIAQAGKAEIDGFPIAKSQTASAGLPAGTTVQGPREPTPPQAAPPDPQNPLGHSPDDAERGQGGSARAGKLIDRRRRLRMIADPHSRTAHCRARTSVRP